MAGSNKAVDRVRPITLLEDGEHGQVFVGIDDVLLRRLVVKKLTADALPDRESRDRLIHEARVLTRLDHPNVLRVYSYHEADHHDVITFEHFEGTPLVDALADGLDFAKKVRIALAVASVLSVAHRHELVHGAISPGSVAIARPDQIKIIDFRSISTSLDPSRGDSRWYSPEESRGAEATRESDMYRFGLLLQEMFGTRDRDVRALIAELLCDAPSDRLTAAAALERLQGLGHRRVRRLRIAAAGLLIALVAVGATKYSLDLRRERSAALAAKADADARRADANALVAFMVDDLRPKLLAVGKLEIMDATSNKAFEYFASIDATQISAGEAAVNVQALTQFAQAQLLKNDVPAAETSVQKALALADGALRRNPGDIEVLYARANAHSQYAMVLSRKGDIPQGIVQAGASVTACSDLLRRKPAEERFLRAQANAFGTLGYMHGRAGDIDASFRNLDIAVARLRLLPPERDPELRTQFFDFDRHAATGLIKLGRFREARYRLEGTRAEIDSLRGGAFTDRELLSIRAGYDDQLAAVALATGDLDAARFYADDQLAVSNQLVAFEPARFRWIRLLVMARRTSGTIARMNGDVNAAMREHTAAIAAASAVLARGSDQVILPRENAASRVELARSLLAAGNVEQALLHAGLAVDVCAAMPDDLGQAVLADALLVRGEALAAQGKRDAANEVWEEAVRVVGAIQSRPPDPRTMDTQARALLRLGRLDRATPLIEQLAALGYRNREFEALCKEKGAITNP